MTPLDFWHWFRKESRRPLRSRRPRRHRPRKFEVEELETRLVMNSPQGWTNPNPPAGDSANIGDVVFHDANANGLQDPNEFGLGNVLVKLYRSDDTLIGTTTTDAQGQYSFSGLPLTDSYYLVFTAPDGFAFSPADQGTSDELDSDVNPLTGRTSIFSVVVGDNGQWDAGLFQLGGISGTFWSDDNGDGQRDGMEAGLPNWRVFLDLNDNNQFDPAQGQTPAEPSRFTNNLGQFSFTGLRPGTYILVQDIPVNWIQTLPGPAGISIPGQQGGSPTNRSYRYTITLAPEQFLDLVDFGIQPPDTTRPDLYLPGNQVFEATSSQGSMVTYPMAYAMDDRSTPTIAYFVNNTQINNPRQFPLGTTTVDVVATDAAGNSSTGSFLITIQDATPPMLMLPASQYFEATGPSGTVVNFSGVVATDAVSTPTIKYLINNVQVTIPRLFPLGSTTVQVWATDAAGNTSTGSFQVTVQDTTPPTLIPPGNQIFEASGPDGKLVTLPTAIATDAVSVPTIMYYVGGTPITPTYRFPLGTTSVLVNAVDAAGNWNFGMFTVTVRDTTPPALVLPPNQSFVATSASGAMVHFTEATATDAVSAPVTINYFVNGSPITNDIQFPLRTTTVEVQATDLLGNRSTGSFQITVKFSFREVIFTGTIPTFVWPTAVGAARYDIWVDDLTSGKSQVLRKTDVFGTSFNAGTALSPGHIYRWWLRSANSAGVWSSWSDGQDFSLPPLAAPELVGPDGDASSGSPTFSWKAVPLAVKYDLWISDVTSGGTLVLRNQEITGTNYTLTTTLTPGRTYRWWVRAISDNGTAGAWSKSLDFNVGVPQLTGPIGVINTETPTFTWSAVSQAARYEIWVNDLTTGSSKVLGKTDITTNSFTSTTTLAGGHSYQWWVRAITANGTAQPWSKGQTFSSPAPVGGNALGAPGGAQAVNNTLGVPALAAPAGAIGTDHPTFTWTAVVGAARYDIWVDDQTSGRSQVLRKTDATGTSFTTDTALSPGHTFRWWVRAVAPNGSASAWNGPIEFTTSAMDEPVLTGPNGSITSDRPTFTWAPVAMAPKYDLWVDDLTAGRSQVLRNANLTSAEFTSSLALTPGHTYRWWVRAISTNGTSSEWSNPLDFSIPALMVPVLSAPTGSIVNDRPTFSWSVVPLAARYDIRVLDLTTGQNEVIRNQNVTSLSFTPTTALTRGHTYRWSVRALSENGTTSLWSESLDFVLQG